MKIKIIFSDYRISDIFIEMPSVPNVGDCIQFPFDRLKYTNGNICYDYSFTVSNVKHKIKMSENNKSFEYDIPEVFLQSNA